MKFRKFGPLGWDVSEIGFGAWAIGGSWGKQDDSDSLAALHKALDLGVNFIDTAAGLGTVIPGIRNMAQAQMNCTASELAEMPMALQKKLWEHNWRRAFWYAGK